MSVIYPETLKKGDTIGIIAPANWQTNRDELIIASSILQEWGFNIKYGKHISNRCGYLAGTDEERLEDFNAMWQSVDVKAILCWGNKWGAARLLKQVNYTVIQNNPKIFVGCGNISSMLTSIYQNTKLVTFHGPTVSQIAISDGTHSGLRKILTMSLTHKSINHSGSSSSPIQSPTITGFNAGYVKGQIIGGNLSAIAKTLGTPYEVDTKDKILFLEAHDAEVEFVERDLACLHIAGKLRQAKAIIFAESPNCDHSPYANDFSFYDVVEMYLTDVPCPTIYGFRLGFGNSMDTLPIGGYIAVDTTQKTLTII